MEGNAGYEGYDKFLMYEKEHKQPEGKIYERLKLEGWNVSDDIVWMIELDVKKWKHRIIILFSPEKKYDDPTKTYVMNYELPVIEDERKVYPLVYKLFNSFDNLLRFELKILPFSDEGK